MLLLAALDRRRRPGAEGLTDAAQPVPPPRRRSCSAPASTACSPASNGVLVLMAIELMLNAVNINLVAFGAFQQHASPARCSRCSSSPIAAAEVGVGLAIVLLIYRNLHSVDLDDVDAMKG